MGLWGALKKAGGAAFGAGSAELKQRYGESKDFLEACCAGVALVAAADGEIEKEEIAAAIEQIGNNAILSGVYQAHQIKECAETMFGKAMSFSGRQQLQRELKDIQGQAQMCEDVYLICLDVAHSDGQVEKEEEAVLQKIANLLGVDPKKFAF